MFDLVLDFFLVNHEIQFFIGFSLKRFPTEGKHVSKIHVDSKALKLI